MSPEGDVAIETSPLTKRQHKDAGRHQEEHQDKVHDGKPAVAGRDVAEEFAHGKREPHEGDRVEDEDAKHVEEQVHQCDLKDRNVK